MEECFTLIFCLISVSKPAYLGSKMSSSDSSEAGDGGGDTSPYPPDEWTIRPKEEFEQYRIPDVADKLEGALLLYVDRSGYVCGKSKFVLDGRAVIDVELPASELMMCGGSSGYKLAWQVWPRDIRIRSNATTSAWIDFADRYSHFDMNLNILNLENRIREDIVKLIKFIRVKEKKKETFRKNGIERNLKIFFYWKAKKRSF
jgi:hypothetical protein